MLNTRPKWTKVIENLKEEDVVLVLDQNLPRGQWPLGRIVETYPGKDGHSRVAKVQCGSKTVVRPIHKLVPLFSAKRPLKKLSVRTLRFSSYAYSLKSPCGPLSAGKGNVRKNSFRYVYLFWYYR